MKYKEKMFDFEVFENWWCVVIGDYPQDHNIVEEIKDNFLVISSNDNNPVGRLQEVLSQPETVFMGYNIKRYDNIILNGVMNGFTPHQLKLLSDIIINPEVQYSSPEAYRVAPFAKRRYNKFVYQDMLDDNSGSLKSKETCMQLDIRETTVPFDKIDLTEQDIEEIVSYCKHDVWASMMFYKVVLRPFIDTKLLVGRVFNMDIPTAYRSTNANLSAIATGAVRQSFPDKERQDIELPNELKDYINYSLPKDVVTRLCASPDKFNVKLFDNLVSYSNGGIHSVPYAVARFKASEPPKSLVVEANDEWALVNVDATSFYPAMMIEWKTLSRAIQHPEKFADMYHTRIKYKDVIGPFEEKYGKNTHLAPKEEYDHYQYCKDTSQAYKLILNTTYGASGNKYLALYDPYMTTKTCRIGQLLLTALANNIYNQVGKSNVQVIQTNTDGVLCYIKRTSLDLLHAIGDEFTRVTRIGLEYENETKIWQRDVNNYIMGKTSGREKSKGGFFVTDMIQPGYNRTRPLDLYVCREAMKSYLVYGKDIVEHIYGESDLSKFIITCSKGVFSGIVREFNDGRPDEVLHKENRAYASMNKNLGMIRKLKRWKGEVRKHKCSGCPPNCELLNNDLSTYDINKLRDDIDYMWYIQETIKLLSDPWYQVEGDKIIPIKIFEY